MTEYQDKIATRELGTSEWFYIGDTEDGKSRVYQTNNGDMFATSTEDDRISFEVYMNDEGEFLAY